MSVPSGNSGLSFDSSFLSPLSRFCLVLFLFLFCHFSAMVHSPYFFGFCLILKEKLFFPCHTCFSVTILWVGCSTLKWMNPLKNCT